MFYNPQTLHNPISRFHHVDGEWFAQEVGTQQLLTRKGLYYALYRQQDASVADSQLDSSAKPSSDLDVLHDKASLARRKVFFDSPGLLEQSQHWGGLVLWTIAAGTLQACCGHFGAC